MIAPEHVTACLVTRGDQPPMIQRIRETLIFEHVIVWDNSIEQRDWKCAGRYAAAALATTRAVYFQDDDVIVPAATQQRLCDAYMPGVMIANWGHGDEPAGYDDLPLVCSGAIVDRDLPLQAIARYEQEWPLDDDFGYEADFVVGVLYHDFRHLHLPFEIVHDVAQHPSRLVNQPFQQALKFEITNRARRIRDNDPGRTYPDWYARKVAA